MLHRTCMWKWVKPLYIRSYPDSLGFSTFRVVLLPALKAEHIFENKKAPRTKINSTIVTSLSLKMNFVPARNSAIMLFRICFTINGTWRRNKYKVHDRWISILSHVHDFHSELTWKIHEISHFGLHYWPPSGPQIQPKVCNVCILNYFENIFSETYAFWVIWELTQFKGLQPYNLKTRNMYRSHDLRDFDRKLQTNKTLLSRKNIWVFLFMPCVGTFVSHFMPVLSCRASNVCLTFSNVFGTPWTQLLFMYCDTLDVFFHAVCKRFFHTVRILFTFDV